MNTTSATAQLAPTRSQSLRPATITPGTRLGVGDGGGLATQFYARSTLTVSRVDELVAADRRKNELLATVCHELRSPLGSIENAVAILRRQAGDNVTQHRMHALIQRQLSQMRLLADGLLDVSSVACGQLRLQRERIDLCTVVRNAIETLESDINQRRHRLAVSWTEVPLWVHADARRLEQVFVNLLGNASKYTEIGGELLIALDASDGCAVVHVRDSGIGIAPEVLPSVFDLFVQADEAARRCGSGFGIGLALVRTLVELHGGNVTAASAGLGQGSEFTVRLPQGR